MTGYDPRGSNAQLLKSMAEMRAQRLRASASVGPAPDRITGLLRQRPTDTPPSSSSTREIVDLTDSPEDEMRPGSRAAAGELANLLWRS